MIMSRKLQDSCSKWLLTVTAICFAVVLVTAAAARAEIVVHYAFSTDASDAVGNNATTPVGTLINGATVTGGSLVLDGTDDYVDLGNGIGYSIEPLLTGSCSIETWVTWSGTGNLNQMIFDFGNGIDPGTLLPYSQMYLSPNNGTADPGNLTYALEPVVTKTNGALVAPGPQATTTAHIVITYNATRADIATKTMYVNGVPVAVHVPSGAGTPFPSSLTSMLNYFGKDQGDDPNLAPVSGIPAIFMGGSISDFRIWNNTLSAADVLAHYNNPAGADALAVWNKSSGNFSEAAKWDTGIVPGVNTTAVITGNNLGPGSLDLNGATVSVGGVTQLNGSIIDTPGTGMLTSATAFNVQNGTISARLAGTAGMNKSTANAVTLSGPNTFSGGVTVNAGYLYLGHNNALGSTSNVLTINGEGTIVDLLGFSPSVGGIVLTAGSLSDNGGTKGVITSATTIDLRSGNVSAKLAGTAGLNKSTTATVNLYAPNTYTGGTTVSAGTLWLDSPARLGTNVAGNDITILSGARLDMSASTNIGGSQNLIINSGAVAAIDIVSQALINKLGITASGVLAMNQDNTNSLDFGNASCLSPVSLGASGGTRIYTGTLAPFNSTYRLGGAGGTLNMNTNLADGTPARSLVVGGGGGTTGTVILAGTNTYSGGTTIVSGTLQVNSGSTLGGNVAGNNVIVQNTGVLSLLAEGNLGSNQNLTINAGGVVSIAFPITNAWLGRATADSQGTLAISQSSSDNLTFTSGISLGASTDATLTGTITPFQNVYRFASGGATLTVNSDLVDDGSNVRSLVLSSGSGGGVLLVPFYGNTYTGGTTVNGGTLQLGAPNALPATGVLTANGGTANLGTFTVTVDGILLNGGTISNGILGSKTTYDLRSGTCSAILTDYTNPITYEVTSIGAVKTGTGTVTLSGTNTYTGKVLVSEGTLRINAEAAIGAAPATLVPDQLTLTAGTTLTTYGSFTVSGTHGTTLTGTATFFGESGTILRWEGPITGPGGLIKDGPENMGLSNGSTDATTMLWNDYSGDTRIVTGWFSMRGTNALPYGPGKGNVIVESAGTFNIQDANTNINGLSGSGTIIKSEPAGTRTLTLGNNDANGDFSGTIGIQGQALISIAKVGAGNQIISGIDNNYTALQRSTPAP